MPVRGVEETTRVPKVVAPDTTSRMMIEATIAFVGPVLGTLAATCPHCNTSQALERRRLKGRFGFIPVPSGEGLTCLSCGKLSRQESRVSRVFGAVFLVPFAFILFAGVCAGLYFLGAMVVGAFSWGFAAIAFGLIVVAGALLRRAVAAIRRLLGPPSLLALTGSLETRL